MSKKKTNIKKCVTDCLTCSKCALSQPINGNKPPVTLKYFSLGIRKHLASRVMGNEWVTEIKNAKTCPHFEQK